MKKYVGMALTLICIVALTSCGSDKKITLPELEKITEIEIIKNTSERGKEVTGKEEISKIISELKDNSESINKESVGDEPTNAEDYICIKFYHDNADDSPSIVYLYKDKDDSFIEQPYSGIWKLKNEIFNKISENLIE
mgnify:FL=1